ncbi:MAG: 2TM domain-containing protein [Pseudanabaenaceae cyanobacterium]
MPPRLSRPPSPEDPQYQSLERRINFALHIAIYATIISGLWFWHLLTMRDYQWLVWLSVWWALFILGQGIWVVTKEKQKQL